jgi:hypothetical protein
MPIAVMVQPFALPHPSEEPIQVDHSRVEVSISSNRLFFTISLVISKVVTRFLVTSICGDIGHLLMFADMEI